MVDLQDDFEDRNIRILIFCFDSIVCCRDKENGLVNWMTCKSTE